MVAYNFKAQFELPIRTGRKCGTIRAIGRRRHARPGEMLQLYTGLRTKNVRLVARTQCLSTHLIGMRFSAPKIIVRGVGLIADLVGFAQGDGFTDFEDMARFWRDVHGVQSFRGLWIRWAAETLNCAP